MFKGFTVAVVALMTTAQVDRFLTNGRYTDAAIIMPMRIAPIFCT